VALVVTIDAGSKADAEVIAAVLPGQPEAKSWRGYGVIRLRFRKESEARELLPLVRRCVESHELSWARVRIGDDERMFRARSRRRQIETTT
jgi:hypothetical protein